MIDVFVRARTSDHRWASVNALDLDERSFKRLILTKLVEAGILAGLLCPTEVNPLTTPLTKADVEGEE